MIVDNSVAADGQCRLGVAGGNAVYSAAGARLWLDGVGVVANIPSNYPREIVERLALAGLDTAGIRVVGEAVHRSEWFLYEEDGSRLDELHSGPEMPDIDGLAEGRISPDERERLIRFLVQSSKDGEGQDFGAFRRKHPVTLDMIPAAYKAASGVHLGANTPSYQVSMAQGLGLEGKIVTADPGPNVGALAGELLDELLGSVTAFLPSEKELRALFPDWGLEQGLFALRANGIPVVGVKLGAKGVRILADEKESVLVPAFETVAADPTGAGDSFCGGFLAGLVLGADPIAAAAMGVVSASIAIENYGPFHLLETPREQALQRLALLRPRLPTSVAASLDATIL